MHLHVPKISPSLVFNDQAEAAVDHYVSVFPDSRIVHVRRYKENEPGPAGSVCAIAFVLQGLGFVAANGGPHFSFSQGLSLYVACQTQDEIDHLWDALPASGGHHEHCGWLVDRFGVSWQIAPALLWDLMTSKDSAASERVMDAVFSLQKLDIPTILAAYDG